MRDDDFYEHGLISITAYWMTVITFTQLNVTSIGLGYNMILKFSLTFLLKASLLMKVYNVVAQVERHLFVIKVTDSKTFNTALHTLACI